MDYAADFETTVSPDDCRVWAWCVCVVGNPEEISYGIDIDSFMEFCKENGGTYYFHNAAFDCEFILSYMMHNGFEYSDSPRNKTFKTLISAMGKFYQMEVCFEKKGKKKQKKAVFKDSLKKLPMRVEQVAKAFDLPVSKLSIDYEEYRPPGHELTDEEREYIKNDVQIVAMALDRQFHEGLTHLTIGSDALNWYKDGIGKKWDDWFPKLSLGVDAVVRMAYRGGWTYADPRFQADDRHPDRIVGAGSVYDVNSLYPDVMYHRPLPIGEPIFFNGEYTPNSQYPLYIQFMTCHCKLKDGFLPTLQIKNNPFYSEHEYVTDTLGTVELALTNIDLDILLEHYDVTVFSYNGGFMFEQATGLFRKYIDHWMHIKATTTGGLRQLAKLMLNSLYGKFATNPDVTPKIPYLRDDGSVGYKLGDKETRDPVYTPMGCFITAWARYKTITTAQALYPRFMYADTDSVHVLGTEPLGIDGIEVHPTNLGAWKHESNFVEAKYVRAKTYMERINQVGAMVEGEYTMIDVEEHNDIKCAGMPDELKGHVTFDNFKRGLRVHGKLRPRHCKGGIVLERTDFTLT